jgi:ribonuclease HI
MNASLPHYLLFSDVGGDAEPGRWRFVLRSVDGSFRFEAGDVEPDARGDRLELLTVVRGLEALDCPSRVTLITASVHVREGIRNGLSEWRQNGWRWECFGQMVPVKNVDLWQRIDRAMQVHEIDCRTYRLDPPHPSRPDRGVESGRRRARRPVSSSPSRPVQWRGKGFAARIRRWLAERLRGRRLPVT